MPSWGRTARARARSRRCWRVARTMRSRAARSRSRARPARRCRPEERARAGLFLGFQYPVEIPGVNNVYLLKAALNAKRKAAGEPEVDAYEFLALIKQKMKLMQMSETFLTRGVNEGFSGGEKKRNEVLQMLVLEPKLAILDETDSGLDIDALKVVSMGVNSLRDPEARRRAGDALSAAARLHRAGPGACSVRRPHLEVGRPLARARARAPRLRLGAREPSRMTPLPHSPPQPRGRRRCVPSRHSGWRARPIRCRAARGGDGALLAARPADPARRELALHEPASARRTELRRCPARRRRRSRADRLAESPGRRGARRDGAHDQRSSGAARQHGSFC